MLSGLGMNLHILGICGTFMGGIAALAREAGHTVSGCDRDVYPPMSSQLQGLGIQLTQGYLAEHMHARHQMYVVGNAMTRGMPIVEAILNQEKPYQSGPHWLSENVLAGRAVCAVAGTHGKTTTSSLLAWLLDAAGLEPGFLIGGVPQNFGISARLGRGRSFVIEADEYDTAFFDKRSKFVHYRPRIAILNNLEFDHADIFERIEDIERQFHHLVRIVPSQGRLIVNADDPALARVLAKGCWTAIETFAVLAQHGDGEPGDGPPEDAGRATWSARLLSPDGAAFQVYRLGQHVGDVHWRMSGRHSVSNALAAIAAACAAGAELARVLSALPSFVPPKRRMELLYENDVLRVFDDFAHHPSAIAATLEGLRAGSGRARKLIVALEPRSNTMRRGTLADALPHALRHADRVYVLVKPQLQWDAASVLAALGSRLTVSRSVQELVATVLSEAREISAREISAHESTAHETRVHGNGAYEIRVHSTGAHAGCDIVLMSNGSFDGAADLLLAQLKAP